MNRCDCDYEIVAGKPHLGLYFGTYRILTENAWFGDLSQNPMQIIAKKLLKDFANKTCPKDLEIRYEQIISKPPHYNSLISTGTIGIKFMIWGRAFKVMRLMKKNVRRYKKVLRNGRRKYVRLD